MLLPRPRRHPAERAAGPHQGTERGVLLCPAQAVLVRGSGTDWAPTELDDGAYQAGATRTVQVPAARLAKSAFLGRLQGFAERKGFKIWRSGADAQEVWLALRSEGILIIAANNGELWRLGFYRRKAAPPREPPSEESVEALVREIRDELTVQPRQ